MQILLRHFFKITFLVILSLRNCIMRAFLEGDVVCERVPVFAYFGA